ncbi:hypothetical protein [Nannocystis sp.]|uniref:hypothetical protein n=1 Tax=Nannocystis sp. TaxID=1962667 RepID=UPI0025EB7872|nr:hypothetical protein [Nannocystis sp.]MBK7823809.1 hypothetical protein [Nannocystis sp.]
MTPPRDSPRPEDPPSVPGRPRWWDRLCVAAFLVLWLIPVFWHGAVSRRIWPTEPRFLHACHDIACLFTTRPTSWNAYYVQVRGPGRPDWQTLDTREYFPMQPFGHRTRLHRFLIDWGSKGQRGRDEVAAFIFARHRELHPDRRQPGELRFVWTWFAPLEDRPPPGRWDPPPVEKLPANRMRILSVHRPEAP